MTTARQYPHTVLSLPVLILFLFQSLSGLYHRGCHPSWVPLGSRRLSRLLESLGYDAGMVLRLSVGHFVDCASLGVAW